MEEFAGKPTKEMLEQYYKSSRQYFDEIAKNYKETDPEYYKKMIAPFYSSFIISSSTGVKPKGGAGALVMISILIFFVGLGMAMFFFLNKSSTDKDDTEADSKRIPAHRENPQETTKEESPSNSAEDNYKLGEKYFNERQWEKAEKYYKLVPEGDDHYDEVQIKLIAIRRIKEVSMPNRNKGPKTVSPK